MLKRYLEDCRINLQYKLLLLKRLGENTLGNNLLWSILLFYVQPLFWVGLLYAFMNYRNRVQYTRKNFRVNFVRNNFEMKDFLLKGVIPGILLSVLTIGIGISLSFEWYMIYQVLTILLLIAGGYRFIHPIFTFSLSSIVMAVLALLDIELPFNQLKPLFQNNQYTFGSVNNPGQLIANALLLAAIILLVSVYMMKNQEEEKMFPILRASKRGKQVAKYQKKSMWLLPLMIVVPGEAFEAIADWWPLLEINGESYAFLFMPILIGFHFTVSTQLLQEATAKFRTEFRNVALAGIALFAISYLVPEVSIFAAGIVLVLSMIVLVRHRRHENQWAFRYGPTNEGLRVIAIRSSSPAQRLNLSVGDIILEMNDQDMNHKDDYNRAVAYNRSYIKMRIRRTDGEIVITQTPLYDDDFNNLGLLILEN